MWNPLRPKYPKKTYKNKYPAEKKKEIKEKKLVHGSAGAYKTRVQNFRAVSKTAWTLDAE